MPSLIDAIIEFEIPAFSKPAKAPRIAWFLIKAEQYVDGKNINTFCKPTPKLAIGIYAPLIKPYIELTTVPTAET